MPLKLGANNENDHEFWAFVRYQPFFAANTKRSKVAASFGILYKTKAKSGKSRAFS